MNYTNEQLKDLRDAIIAHLAGKPVQSRYNDCDSHWRDVRCPNWGAPCFWRPKPEPKTRPWSKPEDVPGPVCWFRQRGHKHCFMVVNIYDDGIGIGNSRGGYAVFEDIASNYEYSTDRKTWHPCEVQEDAV